MSQFSTRPAALGDVLPGVFAELATLPSEDRAARRSLEETIEWQIQRALWRAERKCSGGGPGRRGRRPPKQVRQSAPWVMARRREIAHELTRWAVSAGVHPETAKHIAELGAERFPRDGVVIAVEPRERRASSRDVGDSPRQRGRSPRQLGTSPRQRAAGGTA